MGTPGGMLLQSHGPILLQTDTMSADGTAQALSRWKLVCWYLWLLIWPRAAPRFYDLRELEPGDDSADELRREAAALKQLEAQDELVIKEALASYKELREMEVDRKRAVETRHTAILGLSSIAAATFGSSSACLRRAMLFGTGSSGTLFSQPPFTLSCS